MNFLSHYYFERENKDSNLIVGTVLPDLVKNAHKDWNFYPQKNEASFNSDTALNAILIGWKKHLEVDILFHSSSFFAHHTADLKQLLLPILENSPVRPSFLAHIGVELLLDHLLVINAKIDIASFYMHLNTIQNEKLDTFLTQCGADNTDHFFKFFNGFKSSRYLFSYQKLENISYALQRICMRLWTHPFDEKTVLLLTDKLEQYKSTMEKKYMDIYEEIDYRLINDVSKR